jgi:hypothetical protein
MPFALRDVVDDRHAGQMSGDGFAAGLGARAGLLFTLRRGFEGHLGAEDLVQLRDRLRFVEQLRLAGGDVQLLATCPVAIGL